MQYTLGTRYDPTAAVSRVARHPRERATRKQFPKALAIAIYFGGALIETLGLGLIAAYGAVLVGGATFIFGLAVRVMERPVRFLHGAPLLGVGCDTQVAVVHPWGAGTSRGRV
jgi:hypothetical protein